LMTFLLTSPMRTTSFMVMVSLFSLFFFTHFFLPEFRSRNINSDNFLLLIHLFHDINIRLTWNCHLIPILIFETKSKIFQSGKLFLNESH
jgi:hypothetical protein